MVLKQKMANRKRNTRYWEKQLNLKTLAEIAK